MKITEIDSGRLTSFNIPDFSNSTNYGRFGNHNVHVGTWNGYTIAGVLDAQEHANSYVILKHLGTGDFQLVELKTASRYEGQGMATSILTCLAGTKISLVLLKNDIISNAGRKCLLSSVNKHILNAYNYATGVQIPFDELQKIFNTDGLTDTEIKFHA
jgi:hypothetical protein